MAKKIITSKKGQLISEDVKKVLIGAGVAMGGALLTYIADLIPSVNFGDYTPVVVAMLSVLVNMGRKLISETKYR